MRKTWSIVLAAVMVFFVFGCSAPAEKNAKQEDSAKAEESVETEEEETDTEESQKLNEYGITDKQLDAFVSTVKERVQKEYLEAHGIDPAEFTWSDSAGATWMPNEFNTVLALCYATGDDLSIGWESWKERNKEAAGIKSFEEDEKPVNKKDELRYLLGDICVNWLEEEEMDEADYTTFQETTKAVYYDEAYTFSKESQEIIELYSGQTDEIEEWAARYAESISPWEWLIRDKVTFE